MTQTLEAPACGIWECTNEEYHSDYSRVSRSMLEVFRESPSRYHGRFVAKTIPAPEPTEALVFGSLFHVAVLEPEKYTRDYFVPPALAPDNQPWDRRKKDHKEWWKEIEADKRTPITAEDNKLVLAMRAAIGRCPHAANLVFDESMSETAIWWIDSETGIARKSKRDTLHRNGTIIVDIKSCRDASPQAFARDCVNFGYHRQVATYTEGHEVVTGEPPRAMVFVCIEKNEPHDVAAYELDEEAVALGNRQNREALNRLAKCIETGDWTAEYQRRVKRLTLPRYAYMESEYEE